MYIVLHHSIPVILYITYNTAAAARWPSTYIQPLVIISFCFFFVAVHFLSVLEMALSEVFAHHVNTSLHFFSVMALNAMASRLNAAQLKKRCLRWYDTARTYFHPVQCILIVITSIDSLSTSVELYFAAWTREATRTRCVNARPLQVDLQPWNISLQVAPVSLG